MDALHDNALMAGIAGLLGLALVLAGYWMMRASARFACALILATVGLVFGLRLEEPLLVIGATVGLGIVGFFLGDAFYYLYVAANGALAGYVLTGVVCDLAGWEFGLVPGAGGAIVGGFLNLLFERPLGIFGTSVTGSALCSTSLLVVVGSGTMTWVFPVLFVALVVVGCVVQSRATRHLPPRNQTAQKTPARA